MLIGKAQVVAAGAEHTAHFRPIRGEGQEGLPNVYCCVTVAASNI
jgi:hypothetical protein